MRVLYQPATTPPADWREVDVQSDKDWRDVIPDNLVALNILGNIIEGADHYAIRSISGGLSVSWWDDGLPQYDWRTGQVWTYLSPDFDVRRVNIERDTSLVRGTALDTLARKIARRRYMVTPDVKSEWESLSEGVRSLVYSRAREVNTRSTGKVYVEPAGVSEWNSSGSYSANVRPFSEFPFPPARQTAHSSWLQDGDYLSHVAARSHHGWREWIDG